MEDDKSDISDIRDKEFEEFERTLDAAIKGAEGSLDALIGHPRMKALLNEVSTWAQREFRRDRSDIKEHLLCKLHEKIRDFEKSGLATLNAWLRTVARNYCHNGGRHDNVVARHDGECVARSVHYKRGEVVVHFSPTKTPEEHLQAKEERLELARRLLDLIESFTPETRTFAQLWANGWSAKEIKAKLGWSQAKVYREMKSFERGLVAKVGVIDDLDDEAVEELRSWLAEALRSRSKVA
jgi:RNA polymerase sigma factor (sigma-70 family)